MSANGTVGNAIFASLLEEVAQKLGFTSFSKVEFKEGTVKGDNYLGNINKAKVVSNDGNVLNLVIKLALQGEQVRKQMPVRDVYLREIFMYETIFPAFKQIESEKDIPKPFCLVPKCYMTSRINGTEALILEDLSQMGYKMWNRVKPMDEHHVKLTLQAFGQFHALSMAMYDQKNELFEELALKLTDVMGNYFDVEYSLKFLHMHLDKAIAVMDEDKDEKVILALKKFKEESLQFVKDVENVKDHRVIIHGDCWCNNFLFKYGVRIS